ncbi:MAG: histidine kinase [Bryobacteraceae bacterium]
MSAAWKAPSTAADQPLASPRRSGRVALLAGFGGMFLLLGGMAVHSLTSLTRMERQRTDAERLFLAKAQLLEHLRSDIYSESIELRQYVLAAEAEDADSSREALRVLHSEIAESIKAYESLAGGDEAKSLDAVKQAWGSYSAAVGRVLEWDHSTRRRQGRDFLARAPEVQRLRVLSVSERINALNERHLRGETDRSIESLSNFRERVLGLTAVTVLLGLILTTLVVRHILKLEADRSARYRQLLHAQEELHELSAELVKAQEAERRNIARELHDQVGQTLGALLMDVGRALNELKGDSTARTLLAAAKEGAERAVNEVRNLGLLLRPSMLDDLGLAPAIHWQAREVSRRTGLRVDVDASELPDTLPDEHRTCVFRIVQEALNNAGRHANASLVQIAVRQEPERLMVVVRDNGVGFDPHYGRGMGIVGMEERVRHLGGVFELQSEPGKGTLLKVELPITDLGAAEG